MRGFLINKNLCFYYWLKKIIGKESAFWVANNLEKAILIFGREEMPYFDKNGMLTEQKEMVAYKIYWHDGIGRDHLIGILPERRKNPKRITHESIINLGKKILGENVYVDDIFFVKITQDKNTGRILWPNSVYGPVKEF